MNKSINVVFLRIVKAMKMLNPFTKKTMFIVGVLMFLVSVSISASAEYSGDSDKDGIGDSSDRCYDTVNWTSSQSSDFDSDGCQDSVEDWDDDNDDVADEDDLCPYSPVQGWKTYQQNQSGIYLDFDHDGCLDAEEDDDDDDDGIEDSSDQCQYTRLGATIDSSGCETEFEDNDNDGIADSYDQCAQTPQTSDVYWNGCLIEDEIQDYDKDGVIDEYDVCFDGRNNWLSNFSNDYDADGCQDDNDGVHDTADDCNKGHLRWSTYMINPMLDFDHDGCQDEIEDDDDDNDGIKDNNDQCLETRLGAGVDNNGCEISFEDDDNDGVENSVDNCDDSNNSYEVDFAGCTIWVDDDGDNIPNWDDECPDTIQSEGQEIDSSGCVVSEATESGNGVNNNNQSNENSAINEVNQNSSGSITGDETTLQGEELDSDDGNWWSEIPVIGGIVDDFYSEYGGYIAPTVFGLGVIGYAYRAATRRSEYSMGKRVKKFKRKITDADNERELRKLQIDIEQADEKRLLPRGALGDLLSLIELRAEDLGLTDFISPETVASTLSSAELEDGVNALNVAREQLKAAVSEIKSSKKATKTKVNIATRNSVSDEKKYTLKGTGNASISRPSYHPKDINRDGVVDEEDERIWSQMTEEEKAARTMSPFGGSSNITAEIIAFSKLPPSPNSICHCGKNKKYSKCCMKKDLCPCGNGKKFYHCCAEKKGYR